MQWHSKICYQVGPSITLNHLSLHMDIIKHCAVILLQKYVLILHLTKYNCQSLLSHLRQQALQFINSTYRCHQSHKSTLAHFQKWILTALRKVGIGISFGVQKLLSRLVTKCRIHMTFKVKCPALTSDIRMRSLLVKSLFKSSSVFRGALCSMWFNAQYIKIWMVSFPHIYKFTEYRVLAKLFSYLQD